MMNEPDMEEEQAAIDSAWDQHEESLKRFREDQAKFNDDTQQWNERLGWYREADTYWAMFRKSVMP